MHDARAIHPTSRVPPQAMVRIDGRTFRMGSDDHYAEEAPARPVRVDGFEIQARPVTNDDFSAFVGATGWVTSAERAADPAQYPGAIPELLAPASVVFTPTPGPVPLTSMAWWAYVPGADWRHPTGPDSSLDGLWDHPVVHLAWDDVQAYLAWAGLDLPTEAEWELAAKGDLEDAEFAWGDELTPDGRHMANTWQGGFPYENTLDDGWLRTSPVGAYPPNGHGLYDMIGNVWEWTRDWWSTPAPDAAQRPCCAPENPRGGPKSASHAPGDQLHIPRKVLKGGSHLCAPSYCRRYRPAARHAHPVDTSTSHIGFRGVRRSLDPVASTMEA